MILEPLFKQKILITKDDVKQYPEMIYVVQKLV